MPRAEYSAEYQQAKRVLQRERRLCVHCGQRIATVPDHQPPLSQHRHVRGTGCCRYLPSCWPCSCRQGAEIANGVDSSALDTPVEVVPEPAGFGVSDPVWDGAPWLDELRDLPDGASWPRLMTVPHPDAVGTLGPDFVAWAEARSGGTRTFRWWQRLAAYRMLEHDAQGRLCWAVAVAVLVTVARQVGKSWWLRELALWRMHQADRFGAEQTVVHTGKDLAVCKDVQRPAIVWAKHHPDLFRVREVNGQESIELLADGSRWLLKAKDAVYGQSADLAMVDEAWKVTAARIEEGVVPTLVEREQSQLVLVSTAHRLATALMIGRRATALAELDSGTGDLLLEWSAPPDAELDDVDGWRAASPHWTPARERLIRKRLTAALSGESDDVDEPDPIAAFTAQWLNRWPARRVAAGKGEALIEAAAWAAVAGDAVTVGPLAVGVEDNYGRGAAVAIVGQCDDGRLELGGWECSTWDEAIGWAVDFAGQRPGSIVTFGKSMAASVPDDLAASVRFATSRDTAAGLALLRQLVADGAVVVDGAPQLGAQVTTARVTPGVAGLTLVPIGRGDLVRAVGWAVQVAERGELVAPAIYGGAWSPPAS